MWPRGLGGVQVELKRRGPVRVSVGPKSASPSSFPLDRFKKKNSEGEHTETERYEPGTRTPANASVTTTHTSPRDIFTRSHLALANAAGAITRRPPFVRREPAVV
jgi:hypothetical protein